MGARTAYHAGQMHEYERWIELLTGEKPEQLEEVETKSGDHW